MKKSRSHRNCLKRCVTMSNATMQHPVVRDVSVIFKVSLEPLSKWVDLIFGSEAQTLRERVSGYRKSNWYSTCSILLSCIWKKLGWVGCSSCAQRVEFYVLAFGFLIVLEHPRLVISNDTFWKMGFIFNQFQKVQASFPPNTLSILLKEPFLRRFSLFMPIY